MPPSDAPSRSTLTLHPHARPPLQLHREDFFGCFRTILAADWVVRGRVTYTLRVDSLCEVGLSRPAPAAAPDDAEPPELMLLDGSDATAHPDWE